MPYLWRRLTPEKQQALLQYRQRLKRPWHRPPHFDQGNIFYHLTGACFEHQPFIGHSPERMAEFSELLLDALPEPPAAWCVLPNHYHVLVRCAEIKAIGKILGKLHGSTSFRWNGEEDQRGRKIWHSVSDRAMRNTEHFRATINYIHHNPVKHGHVEQWTDWPFSSAIDYLDEVGREQAVAFWKQYPVLDYGKGWDD
jgi:putative transposase